MPPARLPPERRNNNRRSEIGGLLHGIFGLADGLLQVAHGFLKLTLALQRGIVGRLSTPCFTLPMAWLAVPLTLSDALPWQISLLFGE
jgi:hypothetical protein